MPRARTLSAYATDHYCALVRRVISTGAPVLVRMSKPNAATLRGEIYAWRRAAESAPVEAQTRGIDLQQIRAVSFRIVDEGLEALPVGMLTGPSAIAAALGEIERTLSPADAALKSLRDKLEPTADRTLPYDIKPRE
jgi:hypothetical protein